MERENGQANNPFLRQHYFADQSNMMRQHMPYGLSSNQQPPVGSQFSGYNSRRQSYGLLEEAALSQRNPLDIASTVNANPWSMSPYSPPVTGINHFNYPPPTAHLPQHRWEHHQNSLLSPQQSRESMFTVQYQQFTAMQALQREAQAKAEREQEALRERDAIIQRNREMMLQQEQRLQMEREAELRRNYTQQQQQAAFNHQDLSNFSTSHLLNMSHQQRAAEFMQKGSLQPNFMQGMHQQSPHLQPNPPQLQQSNLTQQQQEFRNAAPPTVMPELNKSQSMIFYPESTTAAGNTNNTNIQWQSSSSLSSQNIFQFNKSSAFENSMFSSSTEQAKRTQFQNNQDKEYDDIDLQIDQHLSELQQHKGIDKQISQNDSDSVFMPEKLESLIDQQDNLNNIQNNVPKFKDSHSSSRFSDSTFNTSPKTHSKTKTSYAANDTSQQPNSTSSTTNKVFSQNNSLSQNNAFNINININMPSHTPFPFSFPPPTASTVSPSTYKSQSLVSKTFDSTVVTSQPQNNDDDDNDVCFKIEKSKQTAIKSPVSKLSNFATVFTTTQSVYNNVSATTTSAELASVFSNQYTQSISSVSTASSITSPSEQQNDVHQQQKTKMPFSSIECLLGMSSSTTQSKETPAMPFSQTDISQERISVIKPLRQVSEVSPIVCSSTESDAMNDNFISSRDQHFNHQVFSSRKLSPLNQINTNDQEVKAQEAKIPKALRHPSLRLSVSKSPLPSPTAAASPQSESKPKPIHPSLRLHRQSSKPLSPLNEPTMPTEHSINTLTATSPVISHNCSGKPFNYPVPGGKPANYSSTISSGGKPFSSGKSSTYPPKPVPSKPASVMPGGKPTSFSSSISGGKPASFAEKPYPPVGGKPLSYLKSIQEENEKKAKPPARKAAPEDTLKKKSNKRDFSKLHLNKIEETTLEPHSTPSLIKKPTNVISEPPPPYEIAEMLDQSSDSDSSSSDDEESVEETDNEDNVSHSSVSNQEVSLKRKSDTVMTDMIANLKKRKFVDESLIQIPLQKGWRRQTRLRPAAVGDGLRADVYYYSPCGKKLRTYPEINTHMIKKEITDVQLGYFSFSMKLRVGEFLEAKEQGSKFEKLNEEEITDRLNRMTERARKSQARESEKQVKARERSEQRKRAQEEKERKKQEVVQRRLMRKQKKQMEIERKAEETRLRKLRKIENAKEAKRLKESILQEKQQAKERKEQEKQMKMQKKRPQIEKNMQITVKPKQASPEKPKIENTVIKAKIREMRRQQVVEKAEEKEKRRREMVMMKAYEVQRRAEEKERIKEHKRLEKNLMKQRKLEQQRYEKMLVRELKKPTDDMSLKDLRPLPELVPVPNLNLSGKAYADLLMVAEFIRTFGGVMDIDCDSDFPSMGELQCSLLCESGSEEAIYNACQSLLMFAIFDPGVSGTHAVSSLGVALKDIELNEWNISEVLRLFMLCRNNNTETPLSSLLCTYPLVSLSPACKAECLAYLCNELLCGRAICRQIESSMENMASLRRDKWILEGDIRRLKADIGNMKPKNKSPEKKPPPEVKIEDEEDKPDIKNPTTIAEKETKIKQLERKHLKCRGKLITDSHNIRGIHLGQDRYQRRYFVLPNAGGVYVEGLESGRFDLECATNDTETTVKQEPHDSLQEKPDGDLSENLNLKTIPFFSLGAKKGCKNTVKQSPEKQENQKTIVAPSVQRLGTDARFLESIYGKDYINPNNPQLTSSLLGLPPGVDISALIEKDPQRAAELLEIQSAVPKEIPEEMKQGWWRITDPEIIQRISRNAHQRAMRERGLQKVVTRFFDHVQQSCRKDDPFFSLVLPEEESENKPPPTSVHPAEENSTTSAVVDEWFPQLAYASDKAILMEIEELEEKVFSASLQVKGWHLRQKASPSLQFNPSRVTSCENKPIEVTVTSPTHTKDSSPLQVAQDHLLTLEAGIERRYLKHQFAKPPSTKAEEDEGSLVSSNQQVITPALIRWREAVEGTTSASQLSMCASMLNECIAWEKSIMKVFCIMCRKSDNEDKLLLCDACDRGCHMYCCKPRLDAIPEGDWFCPECVLMASGSDQCYACKVKSGKRLKCSHCPRHYHLQCLEPPLQKTPRAWSCPVCKKKRVNARAPLAKKKSRIEQLVKEEELKTKTSTSTKPCNIEECVQLMSELEQHVLAWPFVVPVNLKQFPEYYKLIKNPMDFQTMATKLRENSYKNREEFAKDARLVFKNCNTFNEDFSEVGKAGKAMSRFFEKRWSDLFKTPSAANKNKQQPQEQKPPPSPTPAEESDSESELTSSESESSEIEDGSEEIEDEEEEEEQNVEN